MSADGRNQRSMLLSLCLREVSEKKKSQFKKSRKWNHESSKESFLRGKLSSVVRPADDDHDVSERVPKESGRGQSPSVSEKPFCKFLASAFSLSNVLI